MVVSTLVVSNVVVTIVKTTSVETTGVETTTAWCHPPHLATHAALTSAGTSLCPPHDTGIPGSPVPTLPKYLPPFLSKKRLIQANTHTPHSPPVPSAPLLAHLERSAGGS